MNWSLIQTELTLRTARSGGAGGQHVNKVESKVELVWHPLKSDGLSETEKYRLKHHLSKRIDGKGQLTVVNQSDRSQHKNRKRALDDLRRLILDALRPIPKKRKAGAFVANRSKRRAGKERRSEKKAWRKKIDF